MYVVGYNFPGFLPTFTDDADSFSDACSMIIDHINLHMEEDSSSSHPSLINKIIKNYDEALFFFETAVEDDDEEAWEFIVMTDGGHGKLDNPLCFWIYRPDEYVDEM